MARVKYEQTGINIEVRSGNRRIIVRDSMITVRAIIRSSTNPNRILVASINGDESYTFLPGGTFKPDVDPLHPDPDHNPADGPDRPDKTIEDALKREINEEMGADIVSVNFLGILERRWKSRSKIRLSHQLNLIFETTLRQPLSDKTPVISPEKKLKLSWVTASNKALIAAKLMPEELRQVLPKWLSESSICNRYIRSTSNGN